MKFRILSHTRFWLYFLLSLFLPGISFCQLISVPLAQRIDKAEVIFEGKVTQKASYWDETHTRIYTSNVVSVYKVFKGSLISDQVEIITYGGIVGPDMEQVSHSLQLSIGDIGIFTAITHNIKLSQPSTLLHLKAYSGQQGFIKFDLASHTANDPFTNYKSITRDLYQAITSQTKTTIRTLKKADYKIE